MQDGYLMRSLMRDPKQRRARGVSRLKRASVAGCCSAKSVSPRLFDWNDPVVKPGRSLLFNADNVRSEIIQTLRERQSKS
jgi:hypothetical protein